MNIIESILIDFLEYLIQYIYLHFRTSRMQRKVSFKRCLIDLNSEFYPPRPLAKERLKILVESTINP